MSTTNQNPGNNRIAISANNLQPKQVLAPKDMGIIVAQVLPFIEKSLPAIYKPSASRYAYALVHEMRRSAALQEATAISLLGCLFQAATLGLEIGGALGHAYPVPRFDKDVGAKVATLQIGYKGFVALAGRSDKVAAFDAHVVFEGDTFDIDLGSSPRIVHKPALTGLRNKPVGYYAVLRSNVGGTQVRYMNQEQMLDFRARYVKNASPAWDSSFAEMGRKTVLRSLAKYVPVSVELTTAATIDEQSEMDHDQGLTALGQGLVEEAGGTPPPSKREAEVIEHLGGTDHQEEPGANG